MKAKLEARDDHETTHATIDSLKLLTEIQGINFAMNIEKNKYQALHEALRRFYIFKQERSMTCSEYLENFQNIL